MTSSGWNSGSCSPAGNYILKINNKNTRTRWEICSKLTIKQPERRPSVFIVDSEHLIAGWIQLNSKKHGFQKQPFINVLQKIASCS